MKYYYSLFLLFFTASILNAQIVDIPDPIFRNLLLSSPVAQLNGAGGYQDIDTNNDNQIQLSEVLAVTALRVDNESISSLLGIENFTNLDFLDCSQNQIATLDVSGLTNLNYLNCSYNALSALIMADNFDLSSLNCSYNQLTSIDVSGIIDLYTLNCSDNQLTSIDVSGLTLLDNFSCGNNLITELNVGDLINLTTLNCRDNQLNSLDISGLTSLWYLYCQDNLLSSFTIPDLADLRSVNCENNQLTSLIVNSSEFGSLDCDGNLLTNLDLSSMESLNYLNCSDNQLTSINLDNLSLVYLSCDNNQLTTLDLSSMLDLQTVDCENNQLTNIDLPSQTDELEIIYCGYNNLVSLDVSNLTGLYELHCQNNLLSSLNLSTISILNVSNNQLETLDLTNSPNLYYVNAADNALTFIDFSNSQMLEEIYVSNNLLTSLDLSVCPNLNTIFAPDNLLTTIDVSYNPNLCNFYCDNNNFTSIIFGEGETLSLCNPYDVFFDGSPNLSVVCTAEDNFGWVQDRLDEYGYTDCAITTYCSFDPYGEYYVVQGQVFFDANSDGCDVSDTFASNQAFNISSNDFYDTFYANAQGEFELYISSGSHTITPAFENPDYYSVSPASITVDFPTDTSPLIQDFCVTPNGTHNDLEITLISLDEARPGFDANYKLVYKNKGTTALSGSIDLTFQDDLMDLVLANPMEDSQSTNMLSWNFNDLNPFESREILFTMNINSPMDTPPVNGDDVLTFDATVNSSETDETPDDNNFTLNQTVVNSFDPNDKTCLEGDFITPEMVGDYVHYRIRFENTGTANAINVVVKDHIDRTKFDLSTLVPVDASHDFFARIVDDGSDYYVEFIFENINLPFDDANNDGYIVFKIKTLDTLILNDIIENEAEIYFDFNFPIITNTAETTVATLSIDDVELANNSILLYPNPTDHSLYIKSRFAVDELIIYDVSGRRIQEVTVIGDKTNIEMSTEALSAGTYFLNIKTSDATIVKAFIKE